MNADKRLVSSCRGSRNHSLTVVALNLLLSRARKQADQYANFCKQAIVSAWRLTPPAGPAGKSAPSHIRTWIRHKPIAIRHPDLRQRLGIENIFLPNDAIHI